MVLDLSFINNIDFNNPDNRAFLVIFAIVAIIVFAVFVIVLSVSIKFLKRAVIRIFNISITKIKSNKNKKTDVTSSPWSKAVDEIKGGDTLSKQKSSGGAVISNFATEKKEDINKQKNIVKDHKEGEEKKIAENLSKLKVNNDEKKDTLASKMPSREAKLEESDNREEIKIGVPKNFTISGMASADSNINQNKKTPATDENNYRSLIPGKKISKEAPKKSDASIFDGESEVSKVKLEHKLKFDPKIWQANKQAGLNLSPLERSKLMAEVFSPALGRNISKADLKSSIRKLNQKMLGTKDPKEHEKIRKEVKFFKKIGGL